MMTNAGMNPVLAEFTNPETQQRIASIDAELGTKYGEAAKRFVDRYNNGN